MLVVQVCELGILNAIIHIIIIQIIDIYIMMGKRCAKFKVISNESESVCL